jgi:hypothetical protein
MFGTTEEVFFANYDFVGALLGKKTMPLLKKHIQLSTLRL